jgi:hypothetical protein
MVNLGGNGINSIPTVLGNSGRISSTIINNFRKAHGSSGTSNILMELGNSGSTSTSTSTIHSTIHIIHSFLGTNGITNILMVPGSNGIKCIKGDNGIMA